MTLRAEAINYDKKKKSACFQIKSGLLVRYGQVIVKENALELRTEDRVEGSSANPLEDVLAGDITF